MTNKSYIQVGRCELCEKKATVVFVRRGFLSTNIRMFCEDCSRLHSIILDDANANFH